MVRLQLDEEGYESKAPGVVAKLMGLDSLPTSNPIDPFSDTQSLNEALFRRKELHYYQEHHILRSGKHPKSLSRAEILPPKSAKSIPITQHKLLSPIKKPGFVPSNDLAGIMEAAGKIIEAGPQASGRKGIYSGGSSSVPLKVKELKEKMSQLNKGKSINLAIQAKVNVQRRQQDEASRHTQKIARKKPLMRDSSTVLRQNNQKQNCNSAKSITKRNLCKDGSKKSSLEGKEGSKNVSRKKRIIDGKNEKIIEGKENGTEVVSFTFTTPMTRSTEKMKLSSLVYDVGSDSLSALLEQKLREVNEIESSKKGRYDKLEVFMLVHYSHNLYLVCLAQCADCSFSNFQGGEWELDYIKDVLSNIELMFKDYASSRTRDIINPHLFYQLERKRVSSSSYKGVGMVEKKALFDCVSECLGFRCQRFVGGGFRAWEKGLELVRRKERLVEEVYEEIQGWRRMRNCIVDELVSKDMSIQHGRWLDFDGDGFGIAVDVEIMMFDDLVVEFVADVLGGRIKD